MTAHTLNAYESNVLLSPVIPIVISSLEGVQPRRGVDKGGLALQPRRGVDKRGPSHTPPRKDKMAYWNFQGVQPHKQPRRGIDTRLQGRTARRGAGRGALEVSRRTASKEHDNRVFWKIQRHTAPKGRMYIYITFIGVSGPIAPQGRISETY